MDPTIADPGLTAAIPAAGSVTVAAGTAVFTCGEKKMRAMVAVDDSDASLYALKWTVDHIFRGGGCEIGPSGEGREGTIVIVHVQNPTRGQFYQIGSGTVTAVDAVKKALEENSARIVARAVEVCSGSSATLETMVVEGEPKEAICVAAEKIHPDVAVVGSRGLGKVKRAFLGSVSDYCAHHLNCPVLIVKPPKCGSSYIVSIGGSGKELAGLLDEALHI